MGAKGGAGWGSEMGNGKSRSVAIRDGEWEEQRRGDGQRGGQGERGGGRQRSNHLPGDWGILVTDGDWGRRGAGTDRLSRKAWYWWQGAACVEGDSMWWEGWD